MSHRVDVRLSRTQAEAAVEALDGLIACDPEDEQAIAARFKIDRALNKRAEDRGQARGRFHRD